MHILLTDPSGSKKLVNMALVSEAIAVEENGGYTNLVVPSAANEKNSLIPVKEAPEQIDNLLRRRLAGLPSSS